MHRLLQINKESWQSQDIDAHHRLLLLKCILLGALFGIPVALFTTAFVRARLDHIFYLQLAMWFVCVFTYVKVKSIEQVERASFHVINSLSILLLLILISSRLGDISGAYHHVIAIIIASSFLRGPRATLPYYGLFLLFYLSIATGLWHHFLPHLVPAKHPAQLSLYIDRCLELSFAFGLAFMFELVKQSQQTRIQTQEKIVAQKERQNSINRLAGGIAHEINNPLAILLGYLEILERKDFSGSELKRINPRIHLAAKRIQFVVWSLNRLNKEQDDKDSYTDLQLALQDVEQRILTLPFQKDFELHIDSAQGIHIRMDLEELQNVLHTLLLNAAEAVESRPGGVISLKIQCKPEQIVLEIWDNGTELSTSDLEKFTEPFFTTKLDRPGRGMGLTLVFATLLRASGSLSFRREGNWTVATITLPAHHHREQRAS